MVLKYSTGNNGGKGERLIGEVSDLKRNAEDTDPNVESTRCHAFLLDVSRGRNSFPSAGRCRKSALLASTNSVPGQDKRTPQLLLSNKIKDNRGVCAHTVLSAQRTRNDSCQL